MKRIIFLCMLLAIGWYFVKPNPLKLLEQFHSRKQDLSAKIAVSSLSIGYVLDQTNWTVFALSPENRLVKILANANFPVDFNATPEKRWWYELHYQILDRKEHILLDRSYHFHTRITRHVDNDTGAVFESRFYLDQTLLPTDLRTLLINLSEIENAAFVRFRLAWKDPSMVDVIVRVYVEEKTSERKIGYLWHRLSEEQKQSLAKGNVYPPTLLTEQEQSNLVRHIWQPIGPLGIEGRDYTPRSLYTLKEIEDEPVTVSSILPQGLLVDNAHRGIIPIPEKGGKVRLEFTKVGEQTSQKKGPIQVRWFGIKSSERSHHSVTWSGHEARFEKFFKGGLLEIETSRDLVVRVFLTTQDQTEEITPDPLLVRTYMTHQGLPVMYAISHTRKKAIPFRVDFRYLLAGTVNQSQGSSPIVRYQLLNAGGKILQKGSIALTGSVSLYERFSGDTAPQLVSEPLSYFFSLPPDIVQVRFIAETPVFVTAYNRLPDFVKQTRVPEDYHKYHLNDKSRQPTWFSIQPENAQQLLLANRSLLLAVQYRPPEEKPEVRAGQYEWETFYPEESWEGRYLFTPRDNEEIVRKDQLKIVYRRLPVGKETLLVFQQTVKGLKTLQPDVFFVRKKRERTPLEIFVDGNPYYRVTLSGTRGELQLPSLPTGEHRIKVVGPEDLQCYINYAGSGEQPLLKRFANRLNQSGLRFMYDKTHPEEEILLIHFFAPASHAQPTNIRVTVEAQRQHSLTPVADWTLLARRFIIRPNLEAPVPVLHTQDEFVDQGRLFFLPLGSDLPAGRYPIHITLEQGSGGYLIFSKITVGIFEKRKFFRERGIVNDEMLE